MKNILPDVSYLESEKYQWIVAGDAYEYSLLGKTEAILYCATKVHFIEWIVFVRLKKWTDGILCFEKIIARKKEFGLFKEKSMGRGRKVQREWSKKPGFNKQATSVFSDSSPQGEVFEATAKEKQQKKLAGSRKPKLISSLGQSRYASLLVVSTGLVLITCFAILVSYMWPRSKQVRNQSSVQSTSTVQNESEDNIKKLTEDYSDLIEENRQIDFQIEDILQMVKTMKEPNVLPQDVVEKYGKASSGSIDNSVKGSQLVELTYKLIGEKGDITLRFRDVEGRTELSLVYVRLFRNAWGPVTKSVDDYRTLIPQDKQEGVEVKQAIAELGMPKTIYASKSVKGQVDSISLSYSTTDNMTVSLYFDEVNGLYRLKSLLTSTV
ncbi:hypothetical protein D8878_02405 [Streptococcus sanguinis]|jgi:hypothetical protein|uniref:DUF5067 domain-containing protein n=2 Tax=Streptococcus sanguinis TaxID=1305 RepID=A0AB74DMP5_STRSA|nr:hypothetical protein D8879_03615 [Streptococcus sanguinis]RSI37822.1 hypothetical protein D8878_02405 [Streptococcus sanguinis]